MTRINLLNTHTTSFGDLIGNGKIYRVPTFQRDYSWHEENWEDLWQDILLLHITPNSSHYMGSLVLQSSITSDKEFTIIDGQQRLATLSIMAIAVIDKIQKLVEREDHKEANQERQEILRRIYLSDRDPLSLRYSSKIILNENNNDFYQSNLINFRQPLNIRALSKSNQRLWQAFQYFSNHLEKLKDVVQSGERLAEFLYVADEKFLQDFSLLSISTKGQKKRLARYVLGKLEADRSRIEVNEDSFSIEHILPESPNSNWQQNFTDLQMEEMVYRIGNLTPLEPHLNRQVGNELYSIKREAYQQSVYRLTQNIFAEEWTPDTLARRQEDLARRATHIWRSDF